MHKQDTDVSANAIRQAIADYGGDFGIGPGRYSGHDAISKLSAVRIVAVTDSATVSKTTLPVPGWAGRLAAAKAITIGHGLAEPIIIDSYGFYTS